ncbi:MAG TPA: MFS transporter [Rudaea sp.]|nr:MFS transporter [Rudaea sp.]
MNATSATIRNAASATVLPVLVAVSFCHFLNDLIQSLLSAIYPMLKARYALDYAEIGLIALTFNLTASLLQPVVGAVTDRRPMPYSLALGMGFTLLGLLLLSRAAYPWLLLAAALVGTGSSVFHPESSRIARLASGGRHGFAQSVFQVGGNLGTALGPLLAAFVVLPFGQESIAWFSVAALIGIALLSRVGLWYREHAPARLKAAHAAPNHDVPRAKVVLAVGVLLMLIFSKYFYLSSLSTYLTFYLMERFGISAQNAQVHLFMFLGAVALGTLVGGPVGDRIGRKYVIWVSILGVLPFSLALPHADLFWTGVLTIVIGLILSSAFSAILVYAQELLPGKVGTIAGLFFGFAFGMGGLGAALLGRLADATSIEFVYALCAYLPALGLLTVFLPNLHRSARA